MSDVSIAGAPLIRGKLVIKRRGNWTAYLDEIGADEAPTGQVTLDWLGTSCKGTVLRSGAADTNVQAYMVGGKGGGSKALPAKMYDFQLPMRLVLTDILRDAGEDQSATIDPALLARTLPRYVRRAGNLRLQLDQLANKLGVGWRMLLDGTVWLGADNWTAAGPFPHILSEGWEPASGAVPLLPESIGLLPGQLYQGPSGGPAVSIYVGEIVYSIEPELSSATIYALSKAAALATGPAMADGRLSQALRAVIDEQTEHRDWYKTYAGSVIQQRDDGSLDVDLDDKSIAPLTSVGYRVLPAGARLRVVKDARCDVIFEDGDSERAVALLYGPGQGGHAAAREGDPVGWLLLQAVSVPTTPPMIVMQSVGWTATDPGLPPPPPVLIPGTPYAKPLTITGGSPDLSLP